MSDKKEIHEELGDAVHKIWLAGLGAVSTAGEEGAKLFNSLVEKGETYEQRGRDRVDEVRSTVEDAAGKARDRAEATWEKVEERVDDAVTAALGRIGVPSRDEIATLTKRVEELTALVEQLKPAAQKAASARKTTARKSAATSKKTATRKTTARKTAAKKTAAADTTEAES